MSAIHITTANGREHILAPDEARELYEQLREVFGDAPRVVHYAPYYTPPAPPWNLGPITVGSATQPARRGKQKKD